MQNDTIYYNVNAQLVLPYGLTNKVYYYIGCEISRDGVLAKYFPTYSTISHINNRTNKEKS